MPTIYLETEINADLKIVFDLARSIDLHQDSVQHTLEKAIAGRTSGLINIHESVTWRAKHFGFYLTLTSQISSMQSPYLFIDKMVRGPFKGFTHEHLFTESDEGKTLMVDIFHFESPGGILGKMANWLFLKSYMKRLLLIRNKTIKEKAESDNWSVYIPQYQKNVSSLPFRLKKMKRKPQTT